MALGDDLRAEVRKIFQEQWTTTSRGAVPESVDLELRNDAVTVHGTVLYADLDRSTELVDTKKAWVCCGNLQDLPRMRC